MRSALATVATVTTIVLASLSPADRTLAAEASPKEKDLVTSGATTLPESHPAERHGARLQRVTATVATPAAEPAALQKGTAITTALSADPATMSAAQRAKFEAGQAAAPAPEPAATATAKPAAMSTIGPPVAGTQATALDATAKTKVSSAGPVGLGRAHSVTEALGAIPRPEWGVAIVHEKPHDVSTIGPPAPGTAVAPTPIELQQRAATTAGTARKAPETSTSRPRDPSLPSTQTLKSGDTSNVTPEVKP